MAFCSVRMGHYEGEEFQVQRNKWTVLFVLSRGLNRDAHSLPKREKLFAAAESEEEGKMDGAQLHPHL